MLSIYRYLICYLYYLHYNIIIYKYSHIHNIDRNLNKVFRKSEEDYISNIFFVIPKLYSERLNEK